MKRKLIKIEALLLLSFFITLFALIPTIYKIYDIKNTKVYYNENTLNLNNNDNQFIYNRIHTDNPIIKNGKEYVCLLEYTIYKGQTYDDLKTPTVYMTDDISILNKDLNVKYIEPSDNILNTNTFGNKIQIYYGIEQDQPVTVYRDTDNNYDSIYNASIKDIKSEKINKIINDDLILFIILIALLSLLLINFILSYNIKRLVKKEEI